MGITYTGGTSAVTMSYDAAGRPLEIGNAVFTYDPARTREGLIVPGGRIPTTTDLPQLDRRNGQPKTAGSNRLDPQHSQSSVPTKPLPS